MMLKNILLFLSTLTVGLMAGLFFAWSVSVMPGIKKLPDREFITAMQSMNRAIQNPIFFIAFLGAPLCLVASCFMNFEKPLSPDDYLLLISTIVYLTGVMGITFFGNIPLNNMLDTFNLHQGQPNAISGMRTAFEAKWNYLNNIRTVSAIVSFSLLLIMILFKQYKR